MTLELEHTLTQEETVEATLAFILIDLDALDRRGVKFTIEQEDSLHAIKAKTEHLMRKLS